MGKKKTRKTGKMPPRRGGEAGLRETTSPEMGKAVPESLESAWRKLRQQPAVSVASLNLWLGLSEGRPKQLYDEGVVTRRPGGKCGPEALLEYVCWLRERAEVRESSARGQIELEKLRALKRENDMAEGRVFPVEVLEEALARTVTAWMVILDAVAVDWKRDFPETTGDELECVKRFVAKLRNALAEAAINVEDSP